MSINILLVIVILAAIGKMVSGYKNGMVKEIISLVSLVILCAVVALIANGIGSYHSGRIFNLIIVIVLLAVIGILQAGVAGQVILSFTEESRILSWIFRNNWLRYGLDYLRGVLPIA